MARPDRDLDRLLAELQRMPTAARTAVLDRLSPFERAAIDRHIQPPADPDDSLSPPIAELIEGLRDGQLPLVAPRARDALLSAASALGNGGVARTLDSLSPRASLAGRVGMALGARK